MFGSLGGPEIVLIFVVALIVFGPKRLPEIGRRVGGWLREFRKATGEFRSNIEREIGFDPVTGVETTKKVRRDMWSAVSEPIREIAEETWETAREAREAVAGSFGAVGALDPEVLPPGPPQPPLPGSVPRTRPGSTDRGDLRGDQTGKHGGVHPDSPGGSPPGSESPGSPLTGRESPGPSPGIPESPAEGNGSNDGGGQGE